MIERKCGDRCAAVRVDHATLKARLLALDAESAEVMRLQLALDRADAERAAAKADPVAGLLASLGVATSRVDLAVGMAFAIVIEGVACFCWLLALRPADATANAVMPAREISHGLPVTRVTPAGTAVASGGNDIAELAETATSQAGERIDDLARIVTAIREGTLRCTVTEIRKHLGCSQAKAAALRKQFAQQMQSSHTSTKQLF
ncbi:hypothetical protein [Paraburkholderia xenovorans]